jgi:hypothetical protein
MSKGNLTYASYPNSSRPRFRSEGARRDLPSLVTIGKVSDTPPLARQLNKPLAGKIKAFGYMMLMVKGKNDAP